MPGRSIDQTGEQGTKSSRGRVVDRDAVVPERLYVKSRRAGIRDRRPHELVDERLHREEERPGAPGDGEEGGVEAGERLLGREDADLMDKLTLRNPCELRRPVDERKQALVLVGLAQEEDGLVGEDLGSDVGAVACGHVVDEAREDDPVHSGDCISRPLKE